MKIRTAVEADLDRILTVVADKSVNTTDADRYRRLLGTGEYRPEWTFLAEDDDQIVGLAVWWGFPSSDHPMALDGLFSVGEADPVPMWTELIGQVADAVAPGAEPPSYHIFLPGGWRDDEAIMAALEPRLAAAKAAGMGALLERLRFEWLPEAGVPARSQRLTFRADPDDAAFLDVFKRVSAGSLDDGTRQDLDRLGLDGYAAETLELYKTMPGDRDWWRLAFDNAGELVGFAIPSRNNAGPVVGFLGVVPEHRGNGYSDDLLAEITADLAEMGAERIVADTDMGNAPMAASFRRLGYRNFAVRLVASA